MSNSPKPCRYEGMIDSVRKVDKFGSSLSNKEAVYFKMRHKPSGLFATSALSKYRGIHNDCTMLSVEGKIYSREPKLPDNVFYVYYPRTFELNDSCEYESSPEDWELVKYKLVEIKE